MTFPLNVTYIFVIFDRQTASRKCSVTVIVQLQRVLLNTSIHPDRPYTET